MNESINPRPPTAYDVARLAGVSQSAVSRAFTEGASISKKMRAKIDAAAIQLGYRPNILARSLNKQSTNVVGVVFGHFDNPFFTVALDCFADALSRRGLRMLLFTAETNASADEQVEELLSYQVTAVILMAVNLSSKLVAECARSNIPVVVFNRTTADQHTAFAVTGDNAVGAAAIARRFLETGRRRIAFMAGYDDSSTSRQREIAFFETLSGAGMPPPRRVVGNYSRAGAIEATRSLFDDPAGRPDALFCANDFMAIAAIETMRAEFRLEPGRDCAVIGFDDIPMAAWPSYALTTYSQPIPAMVGRAVAFITGEVDSERGVTVEGELIIRNTA